MRRQSEVSAQMELPEMAGFSGDSEKVHVFDLTPVDVERLKRKKPKTLGIVCKRSECKSDLHCFRPEPLYSPNPPGPCQECGIQLISWDQMYARESLNASQKFRLLKNEWIRHFFFHVPLTPRIEAYARQNGTCGLADVARSQLSNDKMRRFIEALDYNQTKMLHGTIVH